MIPRRVWIVATLGVLALTGRGAAQAPGTSGASSASDTMPAAVVQRFVDAANLRDAKAMAMLVAPDVVFARFPGGQVIAQGRDSIEAMYRRSLTGLPAAFRITVQPRIVEGNLVIDQEHFAGMTGGRSQATWMYRVQAGLIDRAWVLDGVARPAP